MELRSGRIMRQFKRRGNTVVIRHLESFRYSAGRRSKPRSRRWTNERPIVRKPAIRCRSEFATAEVLCLPRRQQFLSEARILDKYP